MVPHGSHQCSQGASERRKLFLLLWRYVWAPSNAFNAFVYPSIALMNPNEEACAQDLSAFVGPAQGSEEEMGLGPGASFLRPTGETSDAR